MDAVLHTEHLAVRMWTLEDVDDCHSIYRDPDLAKYLPGGAHADLAQSRAWLERQVAYGAARDDGGFWALVEKDTGRIIGGVTLDQQAEPGATARIGFHLSPEAHERGYADEVAHALVRYGFDDLQLDRIVGVVLPDDLLTARVLEKVGMSPEGEGALGEHNGQIMAIHRALYDSEDSL